MHWRRSIPGRWLLARVFPVVLVLVIASSLASAESPALDGTVSKLQVVYDGICDPGLLASSLVEDGGVPLVVSPHSPGDVAGCFGTETTPGAVVIDSELFSYATVSMKTTTSIPSDGPVTVSVSELDGQSHANLFPTNEGFIYVGQELMHYSSRTDTSFTVDLRGQGGTTAEAHGAGSLVRAQGKLKLLVRGLPKYAFLPGDPTLDQVFAFQAPFTSSVAHPADSVVTSPKTYLSCRARLATTATGVTSRSRCYAILEPGFSGGPSDPFWPDDPAAFGGSDPYLGPALGSSSSGPLPFHEIASGTIDGSGQLSMVRSFDGDECLEFVSAGVWIQVASDLTLDKAVNTEYGSFRVNVYLNDVNCTGTPDFALGSSDQIDGQGPGVNFKAVQLSPSADADGDTVPDVADDSDGDRCGDERELGDAASAGGLRDPYNRYDYFNPTLDGQNRVDDILAVVTQFGVDEGNPSYTPGTDRTTIPGANDWNLGAPNGQQRVDDILAVVKQFGHDCPVA